MALESSSGWPKLNESELHLRQLLENLPAGAYTCDPAGLITYFNPQAVELWGRRPRLNDPIDHFCGSFKLFSTDGVPIPHDQCWMAPALADGKECKAGEIVIERPDGTRITALAHVSPVHGNDGKLLGAVNVFVDITGREREKNAQSLLASIVESSDDAMVSKSLDGTILSWNAGAERLFGYTAAEVIGLPINVLIPPERFDEEREILARLRDGQRIDHFDTVRVTKDGRRVDISLTISPIRDATGRIIGASKVARDVTQRKQAEQTLATLRAEMGTQLADLRRLQAMSSRLSTTLELQPILDETLRTAAAIEGTEMGVLSLCHADSGDLEVGASIGLSPELLQTIAGIPAGLGACSTALRDARRVVIEDIETDPGFESCRDVARLAGFQAAHSTPLITRTGRVVGVLSTYFRQPHVPSDREKHLIDLCARQAVDFIENARLYEHIREADRRKDEFLAMLAHELRNPLAPITNSLHILRLSGELSPGGERVREIIERPVNHMVRLVDDLLDVSRFTRGKIELRKEPVELAAVIRSALEASRPAIEESAHQLALALHTEPMMVEADPVRLSQVISNLLNNAAKYTEHGGQICLSARPDGDNAVISVRDTGVGIEPEMLPRVFDMFAQIDRTLTRAQGGLGLGLTLAKSLMQMHGGSIEAHSDGLGQGSEFTVRLPLLRVSNVRPPGAPALKSKADVPTRRILVVDDARAALYTLGKLLEKLGHDVWTAPDAESALESARQSRPDIVISDIAMPNVNGYELARRMRSEPGLTGLVMIALTGYGQEKDRQQAHTAGFDHHLVKPISLDALEELLSSLPHPLISRGELDIKK